MNINEIYGLIDRFDSSSMSELNIEIEGIKLGMKKGCGQSVVASETNVLDGTKVSNNAKLTNEDLVSGCARSVTTAFQSKNIESNTARDEETFKQEGGKEIVAPLVGTFYIAPAPGEAPFIKVGSQVKKGDVIGIIEAMKLMNEITAKEDGIVTSIEVEDGAMVEFNQTLIVMK